jgi:hypothetical protein
VPTFTEKQSLGPYTLWQAFLRSHNKFAGSWFLHLNIDGGQRVVHTHDNWTTVANVLTGADWHTTTAVGFDVSFNAANLNSGVIWVGDRNTGVATVRKSLDLGGSFPIEKAVASSTYMTALVYTPWWNNPDELIAWASGGSSSGIEAWLKRTADGGQTWQDRTPIYNGWGWGCGERETAVVRTNRVFHHFVTDPAWIAFAAVPSKDRHGAPNHRLFTSDDEGLTWTEKGDMGQKVTMLGGWPYDKNILIATGYNKIRLSYDWGDTWEDKQWVGFQDGIKTIPIWMA